MAKKYPAELTELEAQIDKTTDEKEKQQLINKLNILSIKYGVYECSDEGCINCSS